MGEQMTFLQEILRTFDREKTDAKKYSPLALAYIGDGVYDLIVRSVIVEKGNSRVHKMHRQTAEIVKAESQAKLMRLLEKELTDEERNIYKRGRNAKSATAAKNASIVDYRVATGFEALIGYLYLDDRMERLLALVKRGMELTREMENEKTGADGTQAGI